MKNKKFHLRFLYGTTEFYLYMNLLWFDCD